MNVRVVLAVVLLSFLFAAFVIVGRFGKRENVTSQGDFSDQSRNLSSSQGSRNGEEGFSRLIGDLEETTEAPRESVFVETDLYEVEFSTYGASILSLKLKSYFDNGRPLEMVQRGSDRNWGAFLLYFDADNSGRRFYGPYTFEDKGGGVYEFRANASLSLEKGLEVPFTVIRTYRFLPDEYMFEVRVSLVQPDGEYLPLNFSGYSYVLETGPQIGPFFDKLDGNQTYRKPVLYNGKKARFLRMPSSRRLTIDDRVTWAGIDGKYFTMIGIPDEGSYRKVWTSHAVQESRGEGLQEGSQLNFVRSLIKSSRQEDRFYFYFGPKKVKTLRSYNYASNNGFGLSNLHLDAVSPSLPVFGWLQMFFKILLELIHRFVGNWGWSIIILTVIVKLFLFPLSLKSMMSTARMSELAPKIKVLQQKYRDDPTALHRAQFELYKREGVNPMAGCLPLLVQLPIFIALYNLFNRFFELHGAPFFGWITDLSAPDTVLDFGGSLPFLRWRSLHVLPIVYLFSQFLMNKVTKSSSTAQSGQMQFLTWVMPFVFFFIFYEVASALLVYWIFSNLISIFQQLFIIYLKNKVFRRSEIKRTSG